METENKEREYEVECEITYNGIVRIKAASKKEALIKAESMMNSENLKVMPDKAKVGGIEFNFGYGIADTVWLIKNNE